MLVYCDRCSDVQPNAWKCQRCRAMLPIPRGFLRSLKRDLALAAIVGGLIGLGYMQAPLFR